MILDTIDGLLRLSCHRHSERDALGDRRGTMTYADLAEESARLANALQGRGLESGQRVAILSADVNVGVVAYFGVWLAGCTAVHVNARLAPPEVEYILGDADVAAVLYTSDLEGVISAIGGLDDLLFSLALDQRDGSDYRRLIAAASIVPPKPAATGDDIAVLGYTSGTSGRPKGAMVSHRALTMQTRIAPYNYALPRCSRLAYSGSLSFVGSFWGQLLPHLYIGGFVRLLGRFDIDSWFAAIRSDRSTFTFVATPLMVPFAERLEAEADLLDHLEIVFHAGSLAPDKHVRQLVSAVRGGYLETYGSTEMVGSATATVPSMYRRGAAASDLFASAGCAVPNAEVWIQRPDGTRADVGETGDIYVSSDTLVDGYWRDEEKTRAAFDEGAFKSGDAGWMDDHGFLYVTGRNSELIISGGANVYPAEVERVIVEHPGVLDVAVFGAPHERWGETVIAAVVPRPGTELSADDIVTLCRANLAGYKKPTDVIFLDELPQNASRKVDKKELRKAYADRA